MTMALSMRSAMRVVARALYRTALPGSVRDAMRVQRDLGRRELRPALAAPPAQARIAVLAPHMDDEVFGCGGTLARAVEAKCEVRVIFLTDGRRGYEKRRVQSLDAAGRAQFEDELVRRRKDEARRAGAVLGWSDTVFLDLPDGDAAGPAHAGRQLAQALQAWRPDAIFLPFLTDPHPDHWAANRLLMEACHGGILDPDVMCWGYEVWTPLVANTFVDVSAAMPRKREAMATYASQIADVQYPRVIEGLNAYRSLAAGVSNGYVEAFFVDTLAEYAALFRRTYPSTLQ